MDTVNLSELTLDNIQVNGHCINIGVILEPKYINYSFRLLAFNQGEF